MKKILVTGAFGLVGTELVAALQKKYGKDLVVAIGHNKIPADFDGILEKVDIREKNPDVAWEVIFNWLKLVLEVEASERIKVFWPSSIAAFGSTTPRDNPPQ